MALALNMITRPILPFPNGDTMPAWSFPGFPQNNMTLTFASQLHLNILLITQMTRLAIFIGGILRAVGYPYVHEGNPLYIFDHRWI
ncbi:MAG: hypothetical protein IPJ39_17360 [Saprospiraceae bacterium]|nr:hypothetical protein [Saprospiraceae bacterium]